MVRRAICFLVCLAACTPTTKATIQLGNGHAATEMNRLETVVEKVGFTKRVFDGPPATAHRVEKDGKIVSRFETPAPQRFGTAVSWTRADGSLVVEFAEYDRQFSPRGEELLQRLRKELLDLYGK